MTGSTAVVTDNLSGLAPCYTIVKRNSLIKSEYSFFCIFYAQVTNYFTICKLNCMWLIEIKLLELIVFLNAQISTQGHFTCVCVYGVSIHMIMNTKLSANP